MWCIVKNFSKQQKQREKSIRVKRKSLVNQNWQELNQAHSIITEHIQREMFFEEIRTLEKGQVSSQSKLIMLHLFLDDERILRVGGRLRNVIVRHYHHNYLHGGSK
ncbi:hypothetical protein TNCV_1750131 [Trichonephila clavipes]|nr:hypothetical protein TNCV_1750131 [Trichonephila clavipes]